MIYIGSDHGGYEMKQEIIICLQANGYEVEDVGCFSNDSVDYPDYAKATCKKVVQDTSNKGILICGTGIGISMAANKTKGIRAGLCTDATMSRLTREHNNANVLCLGARIIGIELAKDIVQTFLTTDFEGGRHEKRVSKIMELEKNE